ncbi:MAG: hypothetical protein FJ266_10250 [Planctomycetes bacterium]|nr:hypothetical protein [Planctomycetota bacterium]
MPEPFLHEQIDTLSQWGNIKKEIPDNVAQNLRYELRRYQAEVFERMPDRQMQKLQAQYE